VNPPEVVMHEVEGQRRLVIIRLPNLAGRNIPDELGIEGDRGGASGVSPWPQYAIGDPTGGQGSTVKLRHYRKLRHLAERPWSDTANMASADPAKRSARTDA
jgi:hypothetical protein